MAHRVHAILQPNEVKKTLGGNHIFYIASQYKNIFIQAKWKPNISQL